MKIEHFAFNVEDPLAMSRWYVEHLGLQVKRRSVEPPYAHFLVDDSGTVMIEIYGNRDVPVLDFRNTSPMVLHCAFVSTDIESDIKRLTAAGATIAAEMATTPAGDRMAMLQDPWGVAVQLVQRAKPMI